MKTLAEIKRASEALPLEEQKLLLKYVKQLLDRPNKGSHSVLDLPTYSVGAILRPLGTREEWYDEMLEDKFPYRT